MYVILLKFEDLIHNISFDLGLRFNKYFMIIFLHVYKMCLKYLNNIKKK